MQAEIDFWKGELGIGAGDSDWYPRLKGAAISMLALHDDQQGTSFTLNYDPNSADGNAATRLGGDTVICQRCHADNVIAAVKSADCGPGQNCDASHPRNDLWSNLTGTTLIPPLTEAIHLNHKDNPFDDSHGRNGGCQGCHESIHGLYPVTPPGYVAGSTKAVDQTSWDQAASMNTDGSHGPLKCGACHDVDSGDIPTWVDELKYNGNQVSGDFDRAVSWMHTYTDEANPINDVCLNCHEDESDEVSASEEEWLEHAMKGRTSRQAMDKVEMSLNGGQVFGAADPLGTVCQGCHDDESDEVSCSGGDSKEWKEHLTEGRVAASVWEYVSTSLTGSTCGW